MKFEPVKTTKEIESVLKNINREITELGEYKVQLQKYLLRKNQLWTAEEFAQKHNLHLDHVRRLCRNKKLVSFKIGREWFIPKKAVSYKKFSRVK